MNKAISILLIEDDKDDQEFFIEVLSEIENVILFSVTNNGKEALELLKISEDLPDLIITDINMPIMNGIECLIEITKTPKIKNIPVVFLSGDIKNVEVVHELGATAFIKKSFDLKRLKKHIEQLLHFDINGKIDSLNQEYMFAM